MSFFINTPSYSLGREKELFIVSVKKHPNILLMMRIIVLLVLFLGQLAIAQNITLQDVTITVELLRPIDPEADEGQGREDFEAAQRIVQTEFGKLYKALHTEDRKKILEAVEHTNESLQYLAEIGGFTDPAAEKISGKRSLEQYRSLQRIVDALGKKWSTPTAHDKPGKLERLPKEHDESSNESRDEILPPDNATNEPAVQSAEKEQSMWIEKRLWDWLIATFS